MQSWGSGSYPKEGIPGGWEGDVEVCGGTECGRGWRDGVGLRSETSNEGGVTSEFGLAATRRFVLSTWFKVGFGHRRFSIGLNSVIV